MASLERRVAIDAAQAAGQLLKRELSGSRRIAYKGSPTNLVTEMDARVEELIVGRLAAAFPDDAVLAEERGASAGRSRRRWIIDPLDGTTNYAHGFPAFASEVNYPRKFGAPRLVPTELPEFVRMYPVCPLSES